VRGAVAACLLALAFALPAESSIRTEAGALAKRAPRDAWTAASTPFRTRHIRESALCAGGLGTLMALDGPVRRSLQARLGSEDRDRARSYGAIMHPKHYPWVAGGLYGAGLAADAPSLRKAGLAGFEGIVITTVFTGAVKIATGRARPFTGRGALSFRPFSGNTSLPSGHTSNAFVMATVIARSVRRTSVSWAVYAVATSVAAARMIEDVHWTSDVAAGALLGTGVGWVVTAGDDGNRALRFAPSLEPPGLAIVWTPTP
jgi:membrane-associated phospholipid phosphatase